VKGPVGECFILYKSADNADSLGCVDSESSCSR